MVGVNAGVGRRFTVLFVEDEALVRDSVAQLLETHGFNVLVAADAYEAIRILVERHVDVLFTDIVMPSLSGFELAQQAKLIRPHIAVLYTTGYADKARGYYGPRYGQLIEKPFRPEQLLAELRKVCCQGKSPRRAA